VFELGVWKLYWGYRGIISLDVSGRLAISHTGTSQQTQTLSFYTSVWDWARALKNLLGAHKDDSCRRVWPFVHISLRDLEKNSNFSKKTKKKTNTKKIDLVFFFFFLEKFEFFLRSVLEIRGNGGLCLELLFMWAPNKCFRALAQTQAEISFLT